MFCLRCKIAMVLASLVFPGVAEAGIVIRGSQTEVAKLLGMINQFSGATQFQLSNDRLQLAPPSGPFQPPVNDFASTVLLQISLADEDPNFRDAVINVQRNLAGVLVDSYGGQTGSAQLVDMADLESLPTSGDGMQQDSVLMHVLAETVAGATNNNPPYDVAHQIALENENFVAFSDSATRWLRKNEPVKMKVLSGGTRIQILSPMYHRQGNFAVPGRLAGYTEILVRSADGGFLSVNDIPGGPFHTGLPFSGRQLDLVIESVRFVAVPEPTSLFAFVAVSLAGFALGRRRSG